MLPKKLMVQDQNSTDKKKKKGRFKNYNKKTINNNIDKMLKCERRDIVDIVLFPPLLQCFIGSWKLKGPLQQKLLSPTENTAPELPRQ